MSQVTTSKSFSEPYRAMLGVEKALSRSRIEPALRELIKLRVSQINGCAYCIDMHWKEARGTGEEEQRLYGLPAWRESPHYTPRERAGLRLAEELTRMADRSLPEEVYEHAHAEFDDREFEDLVWVIASINAWNRRGVGLRLVPGE